MQGFTVPDTRMTFTAAHEDRQAGSQAQPWPGTRTICSTQSPSRYCLDWPQATIGHRHRRRASQACSDRQITPEVALPQVPKPGFPWGLGGWGRGRAGPHGLCLSLCLTLPAIRRTRKVAIPAWGLKCFCESPSIGWVGAAAPG